MQRSKVIHSRIFTLRAALWSAVAAATALLLASIAMHTRLGLLGFAF
jgi:hypothetical protein